jgi:hypothetical protein
MFFISHYIIFYNFVIIIIVGSSFALRFVVKLKEVCIGGK